MKISSNSILSISPHSKLMRRMLVLLCFISMFSYSGYALTYYSRGTFTFAAAGNNWSTSRTLGTLVAYPGTTHDYVIQTGNNVTIGANQTAVSVKVESGGTLTAGTFTLTSPLTIDLGGTLALSTVTYVQAGNLINNGAITGTTGRLTMNTFTWTNAGSITLTTGRIIRTTGSLTNSGTITLGAGQFTATSGTFTNEATGTMTVTGTATITLGTGNFVNNNTAAGSVNFGSSGVALTGTAQSIGSFTTTGAVTATNASGTITVAGNINGAAFTKSGAGTINMGTGLTHTFTGIFALGTTGSVNGGSSTINVNVTSATAWTGTGTVFAPGTSTVNFGSAAGQTITATVPTFYNLTFSNAGTKTIPLGITLTVTNNWTVDSPVTLTTTAIANVTGNVSGSGNITVGSGTIFLEGSWTNNGTLTPGTGTISYDGAGNQTIATLPYYKLSTATGGIKTLAANTTVTNVVTIGASSTLGLSTFTLFLSFTGAPLVNSGSISGTGTVNYSGGGAQTVLGTTYPNLEFSGAGVKTILTTTTATVTNNWIVGSPTTLATTGSANVTGNISGSGAITMGSGTISLEGSWTNNGVFTPSTGTVIYDGAGDQNIATLSYYNLSTATGGIKTLAANTTATHVVTIGASTTLGLSTFTLFLSFTGAPLVNSGSISGTGTVNYSGGGAQTVLGTTYPNLEFSGAGVKTILTTTTATVTNNWIVGSPTTLATTGSANVTGTISGSGAITMGSGTISLEGSWTNNGVFTPSTGTVIYDGAGNQTIATLSYYNLSTATGGIKTLAANTTATHVVTIGASSTLGLSTFTLFLNFTGAPLVNSGSISGTGTVNYSGAGAQTVLGTTYPNLEFSGAGTKTISTGATVTVTTNWVVGSPTTMTTTAIADVGGNISGSGAITMGSGTINIAGNWTNNGTFTRGIGTVIYDGTTQNIGGLTYHNLQTSNSGVKTLAAATTVANVLTIDASTTLNLSTLTLILSGAGTPLVNSGTFTCSTSTVNFSNAGSVNIPALNYNSLNITGGARVLANSGEIGIAAVFTPGAGAFTLTGSTVNFNGLGAQTIPAFTFNDLVLSGSGAKTILNATTVTVFQLSIGNGPTLDLPGTSLINITKP